MDISQIRFALRFDKVTGSAIREIFKVIAQPGMISFAGGNPSPDALPDALVSELSRYVLAQDGVCQQTAWGGNPVRPAGDRFHPGDGPAVQGPH